MARWSKLGTARNLLHAAVRSMQRFLKARLPPPPPARPYRVFDIEDFLIAGWLALGSWLTGGLPPETFLASNGRISVLGWAVLVAFLVVFFSRGAEDADLDQALIRRMFVLGPLVFVLSALAPLTNFIVHSIRSARARRLGWPIPEAWRGWPGPPLPDGLRRVLALPFTLIGESLFSQSIQTEFDIWLADRPLSDLPPFLFFATAMLIATFCFLVVGPRVIAGGVLAWRPWLLRFGLYLAAWAAGGEVRSWI